MATSIMLQGFYWNCMDDYPAWYHHVQQNLADMKAAGFTHIWLPPPSQSLAKQGYLPQQLYDLNSNYGNQQELIDLIQGLQRLGIKTMADIVINHRCAEEKGPNGKYTQYEDKVSHPGRRIDWGPWAVCRDSIFHGDGNNDTGDHFDAAPDLDHTNQGVRDGLKDWLHWLKNTIKFDGFRFDMVKGYSPSFVKEYMDNTGVGSSVCVGEHWSVDWNGGHVTRNQNGARQWICNWIDGTGKECMAFDFPTKFLLNEAVRGGGFTLWNLIDDQGKPPGLLGWWPGMSVTFVENHDTERDSRMPDQAIQMGYAYILTHPGTPCVFWRHMYEWLDKSLAKAIRDLMAVRIRNGIKADSGVVILKYDADQYIARIADKLVVKIGPNNDMGPLLPKEADGWKFACSGEKWAVWEKLGTP